MNWVAISAWSKIYWTNAVDTSDSVNPSNSSELFSQTSDPKIRRTSRISKRISSIISYASWLIETVSLFMIDYLRITHAISLFSRQGLETVCGRQVINPIGDDVLLSQYLTWSMSCCRPWWGIHCYEHSIAAFPGKAKKIVPLVLVPRHYTFAIWVSLETRPGSA